jgi:hypothetical protein
MDRLGSAMPKKKKISEEEVIAAWDDSAANPYTSVNDYSFTQNGAGDWWVIGDDGRQWWAWRGDNDKIAFTEHKPS